jgi:hypothetical protein
MTSISRLMLTAVCASGILSSTFAADVRKNKPARKDVEQILEEIGGEHFPEGIKISPIGPVETDSTYYHVFSGTRKKGGYHLIFFDNTPAYLGYYLVALEPVGYGEGEIYLYLTSDSKYTITIGDEGPPEKIVITELNQQANFIRAPVKEEPVEEEVVESTDKGPAKPKKKPEYRAWTITKDRKALKIESAIFVKIEDGVVTIKNGKNGRSADVPVSSLSPADKEYLKDLLQ